MNHQNDPQLSSHDDLLAENNLLKVKLNLEYGMKFEEASSLSPSVENQWLKSVYAFEQQFKDAKRIKLYDYIGRPTFCKWNTLTAEETRKELQRIQVIMEHNNVALDCICKYDDAIIYKFITEELFDREMDDMHVPGMTCHFIYEEFHPNHDYDLRNQCITFVNAIFTRRWEPEFDETALARDPSFAGKLHDRSAISSIIITFQEAHRSFVLKNFDVNEVTIDEHTNGAMVTASICWSGQTSHGDRPRHEGHCTFQFERKDDYWSIQDFSIPGLNG